MLPACLGSTFGLISTVGIKFVGAVPFKLGSTVKYITFFGKVTFASIQQLFGITMGITCPAPLVYYLGDRSSAVITTVTRAVTSTVTTATYLATKTEYIATTTETITAVASTCL